MNKLLVSLVFMGGCFDLDMQLYTECETQEACADGLVCASGYCITPSPDQIACGNGRIEADEVCDDGDTLNTAPCFSDCSKLCRSLDLDGQSGVAVNDNDNLKTGLIAGAPASVQIWIRPNFPQGQTFEWTLLSKEPDPGGDPVRIDLKRTSADQPPRAVMLIRDQVAASIELPNEQVWTNIGAPHAQSGGRLMWNPNGGAYYPLWLDEGFKLATVEPQCAHGFECGDGVRAPYEECDDGNTQSGDGCSAKCHDE